MSLFWRDGAHFVRDIVAKYDEPKPHFNTISTIVRALEDKGFLSHEAFGATYRYFPVVTEEQYNLGTLDRVIEKYFSKSYMSVVSSLIEEEKISLEDLKKLIKEVEKEK